MIAELYMPQTCLCINQLVYKDMRFFIHEIVETHVDYLHLDQRIIKGDSVFSPLQYIFNE